MNIENMKRLQRFLETQPEASFAYDVWVEGETRVPMNCRTDLAQLYEGHCGTSGCIAGAAAAIMIAEEGNETIRFLSDIPGAARDWLGLDGCQAADLFHGQAMVDAGLYEDTGDALERATHMEAAKVIGMWIDEEEARGNQ